MEELPVNGLYGSNAEMRLEYAISQAWFAQRCANKDAADQYDAILTTIEIAREHPELFAGPEKPDLTPRKRRDKLDLAVRAAVKRWTQMRYQHCTFADCGRPAKPCELDQTTAWAHNGPTKASNLAHLCRHHHRLKHESKWSVSRAPNGATTWTSPTGHQNTTDPPPF